VIKEKYLVGRNWVYTAQLYQASLKTPGETRTLGQGIWEIGIAEGVRKGLFGLGELENDQPICRYFKEEPSISLAEDEILIRADVCEAQRAAQAGQTTFPPVSSVQPPTGADQYASGVNVPFTPPAFPPSPQPFPPTHTSGGLTQLSFNFVVPKGKVSSLMGVLNFLQSRYSSIEIALKVDGGQLSEQEYEDKVKEAFRQMGIEVE